MRCKKQGFAYQFVMMFVLFASTTSNLAADDSKLLDEVMRKQVAQELKVNVEALFEMVKIARRPLLVHADTQKLSGSGSKQDIREPSLNQETLN